MADFVATPVERTSDSGDFRREPKPRPHASKPAREGSSKPPAMAVGQGVEEEGHTLDIQA